MEAMLFKWDFSDETKWKDVCAELGLVCLSPSVYMRVLRQGQTLVGSNPTARHFFLLLFTHTSAPAGGVIVCQSPP